MSLSKSSGVKGVWHLLKIRLLFGPELTEVSGLRQKLCDPVSSMLVYQAGKLGSFPGTVIDFGEVTSPLYPHHYILLKLWQELGAVEPLSLLEPLETSVMQIITNTSVSFESSF